MKTLDKSWEEKSKKFDNSMSSISEAIWMPKGYMEGASDFQEQAIEQLHKYRLEMVKEVQYSSELNSITLDCIQIIQNLKAE
jgi:hypothetical protein